MTWRFRRRMHIAPGLNLNLGKRGVSLSAGVRGAHVTVGRQSRVTVGAPGTGLSVTQTIGSSRTGRPTRRVAELREKLRAHDDGVVVMDQASRDKLQRELDSREGLRQSVSRLDASLKIGPIVTIVTFALLAYSGLAWLTSLLVGLSAGAAAGSRHKIVTFVFLIAVFAWFGWLHFDATPH